MLLQCTMYSTCIFDWRNVDWACANALKHGTITVSGFGYFTKIAIFCRNKCFKDKFRKHNTPIRHITNISDFVWFQRSCGSMKSVFSFSSIDFPHLIMLRNQKDQFCLKEFMAFLITWCIYLWLLNVASGSSRVCWRHNRSYLNSSIQGFSHYPVHSSDTRKLYHNLTEK